MKRAVFLDRDGTLIEEREYLHRPAEAVIFPGAAPALKRLQDAGFLLFIITNQSGVGRGLFTLAEVSAVHAHLAGEFARAAGARERPIDRATRSPAGEDQVERSDRSYGPGRCNSNRLRALTSSGNKLLDLSNASLACGSSPMCR